MSYYILPDRKPPPAGGGLVDVADVGSLQLTPAVYEKLRGPAGKDGVSPVAPVLPCYTSMDTANCLVQRDATGSFMAGDISASNALAGANGDLNADGVLNLTTDPSSDTAGTINKNGTIWISDPSDPTAGGGNFYAGIGAGNQLASLPSAVGPATAFENVIIGDSAGANETSPDNVIIGYGEFQYNALDLGGNVVIGTGTPGGTADALGANSGVVLIGLGPGALLTSGINTVAIGNGALSTATTEAFEGDGYSTVAIGSNALATTTLGDGSVAIGANALADYAPSGDNEYSNVAIGSFAGSTLAAPAGVDHVVGNVFIGDIAGYGVTIGTGNIYIGALSVTPAAYTVANGYAAPFVAPVDATDNNIVIGPVIPVADTASTPGYTFIGNFTGYAGAGDPPYPVAPATPLTAATFVAGVYNVGQLNANAAGAGDAVNISPDGQLYDAVVDLVAALARNSTFTPVGASLLAAKLEPVVDDKKHLFVRLSGDVGAYTSKKSSKDGKTHIISTHRPEVILNLLERLNRLEAEVTALRRQNARAPVKAKAVGSTQSVELAADK